MWVRLPRGEGCGCAAASGWRVRVVSVVSEGVRFRGMIDCGPGALGRDMLAALVTHLRLTPSPQMPLTGESLAFDRMGLDFWIDHRGISIAGHCKDMSGADMPGAVAVAGGRVLLTEPTAQPQPVAALIQALVPVNEIPVPATQQTGRLECLLPIPDAARTK